jgi:hypothetical protein
MKIYKLIFIILVFFFKTGNVLSNNSIFNVNNIEIEKKGKITNNKLADQAIKKGFDELINRILLKDDVKTLAQLKFSEIRELVTYYQVLDSTINENKLKKINFNISFDKDKIHDLFYKKGVSYSKISNKELFILPIFKKKNQIFIYNQNFFYDNWNEIYETDLIEFILPLENIEIIHNISTDKNNLLNLNLKDLFIGYSGNNLALIIIEDNELKEEKIYFKTEILGKKIVKNINLKRSNLNKQEFYQKIIIESKKELTNLVKSQNLIDIRVPSFLNASLLIDKKNNLVELKSRLNQIDLVENLFIKEFNKDSVSLKIKYLGKLENIINQLKEKKVILKLINEEWSIKII